MNTPEEHGFRLPHHGEDGVSRIACKVLMVGLLIATAFPGCESTPDKKIEDARENLREAKHDVKEALTAYRDEWQAFEFDAEASIRDNEYTINEYKKKMVKADATPKAAFNKKIEELDQRNTELKTRLAGYRDEGKTQWGEFKLGFERDMEALRKSLKDLKVDEKK